MKYKYFVSYRWNTGTEEGWGNGIYLLDYSLNTADKFNRFQRFLKDDSINRCIVNFQLIETTEE